MRRSALALGALLALPAAAAEMNMRVFVPSAGTSSLVPIERPTPTGERSLQMWVFPAAAGEAIRRVELGTAASGEAIRQVEPETAAAPAALAEQEAPQLRAGLYLGARRDDLRWSIAGIAGSPDVLSELSWRNQRSAVMTARGELEWPSGWLLAGDLGAGAVLAGEVQDSDYLGNGRTQEFSRSLGESDGSLLDATLAGGYRLRLGAHAFTVSAGYAWHEQDLHIGNVTQIISTLPGFPPVGIGFDARSSYRAQWHGPHAGLDLELALPRGWSLGLGAWREWVDYKGVGNWALREEFAHPESFTHLSAGQVTGFKASLNWQWRKSGRIGLTWGQVRGRADGGVDITHFEQFGDTVTRLNEVVWDSESLRLGLQWSF